MAETINTYVTDDIGAIESLATLEDFIGDMDGKTLGVETDDDTFIDEGTVDASNAVTAINGLIVALERRDQRAADLERAYRCIRGFWTVIAIAAVVGFLIYGLSDRDERCAFAQGLNAFWGRDLKCR